MELYAFCVLFATAAALQNKYCLLSCEFGDRTVPNTVCEREKEKCGPAPNCGPDFKMIEMNDEMRQHVLDLHNYLRNKVAMGDETRGKQPPASNMKAMSYSRELEFIAQCWANACNGSPLLHDFCRSTSSYAHVGQNLGFVNSSADDIDFGKSSTELIMYWYDEVAIFAKEWVLDTKDRGPSVKVGHYTQMIWADTFELGCAATYYTTNTTTKWHHLVFVCNYGPGGNYLGLPVYEIGKPCSKCDTGSGRNKRFQGLCGETRRVDESRSDYEPIFEL